MRVERDHSVELLIALRRDAQMPLVPSSRDLAQQLGVSRGVVVNEYRQLGAEGYLAARQGAPTSVSTAAGAGSGLSLEWLKKLTRKWSSRNPIRGVREGMTRAPSQTREGT